MKSFRFTNHRVVFFRALLVMVLQMGVMVFCGAVWGAPTPENKVILRVNGQSVFEDEYQAAVGKFVPAAVFHGGVTPETRERYRGQAIELLITRELLYQAGKREGIDVGKEVDSELERISQDYGSRDLFVKSLEAQGLDVKMFRVRLEKDLIASRYATTRINDRAAYSEDELMAYYQKNLESFRRPPAMYLWHIILKVPANATQKEREERRVEANTVAELARKGVDFAVLAEKYSEDEYRVVGGKLGLVHAGRLDPQLEKRAFALTEGDIDGPIETIYGFHIIKRGAAVEGELMSFEKIREKLKNQLEEKRLEDLKLELVERLKKNAAIEVLEP